MNQNKGKYLIRNLSKVYLYTYAKDGVKGCVLPLKKAGLVTNSTKFYLGKDVVEFPGMQVTQTGGQTSKRVPVVY